MDHEPEQTEQEPVEAQRNHESPERKPDAVGGTSESAAWFRAALLDIGQTQASMARLMKREGDDRKLATIERHIRRMANGEARVSGEMRVILTIMRSGKRQAEPPAARSGQASHGETDVPS